MEHQISRTSFPDSKAVGVRALFSQHEKKLEDYIDRLLWWNKKINLVSRDVSRETIKKHVEHSLVVTGSEWFVRADKVIDSGTGGGLPGIPLAICNKEKQVHLNDVVTKKIMACKNMAAGLGLENVSTSAHSVEKVSFGEDEVLISKHAFKISDLVKMLEPKAWSKIILLKGGEEVEGEVGVIKESLSINIIDLMPGFGDEFYRGKSMVEISRIE